MTQAGITAALLLWCLAIFLAFRRPRNETPSGGRGGSASALGEDSRATGGSGGNSGRGDGGDGGAAVAKGTRSVAKGGRGGTG